MLKSRFSKYILRALRKLFFYWPPRKEARKRALVKKEGKNEYYTCAICRSIFIRKDTHVDHIIPVVGPEGITSFDAYIDNLFCPMENLRVLCKGCHNEKTREENAGRAKVRRGKARFKSGKL